MADFKINIVLSGVEQSVSTVGELQAALKATKEELKGVEVNSDAFNKLSEQAINLTRELREVKEATNFQQNLGQLTESVGKLGSTVASSFTIATSALTLFGKDAKDLTETQAKAQQALAVAISATTIATNAKTIAQDINNVGAALQNGLTKLLTASLGQQTIATAAQAAATGTATVAQRALNLAMAANPIGLVVAAVTALVGAFILFSSEEEKTLRYTRDLNAELDLNTKRIKDNLEAQKEIVNLEGKLNEARAKTEIDKLKARQETQKKIDQINIKEAQNDLEATNAKIQNQSRDLIQSANYTEALINNAKKLQDFSVDARLTQEQKEYASLIRQKEFGTITQQQYTDAVIEIYKKYYTTTDADAKASFQKQIENYNSLKAQRDKLVLDLDTANKTETTNDQLAKLELDKQRKEDAKKYKQYLDKKKQDLDEYAKDVKKLEDDRQAREIELQRELEDFILERISLVKGADDVFREDLIAGYTETTEKIKTERDRNLADERKAFDESLQSFKETESKRKDEFGKRIISDEQINKEIDNRRKLFDEEQLKRASVFNQQIELNEQEKANKINEINSVLNNELTFGDNNLSDSRKRIALDTINFQIGIKQRELELEKTATINRIFEFNERKKSEVTLLLELQSLQSEARKAQLAADLESLKIEKDEKIKNVQGTEAQKGEQINRLNDFYKQKEAEVNEEFRQTEIEAEKAAQGEILKIRASNFQKYVETAGQIASSILSVATAITEGEKIESDLRIRNARDAAAEQTNAINSEYQNQVIALQEQKAAGILTEAQYNSAVKGLDQKLSNDKKAIAKKQREFENEEKKKAFETDKKLKIAQAIIAGAQGAVSAFTGALQLGPIAGPIVGGILAAAVVAATAIQIANIQKTQFDAGAPEIQEPQIPDVSSTANSTSTSPAMPAQASTGGFTGFQPGLVGPATSQPTTGGGTTTPQEPIKVVVLESDITSAQRRVSVAEANSTF